MKNKVSISILLLSAMLTLTGCFPSGQSNQPQESNSSTSDTQSMQHTDKIPDRVEETLDENVIIQADVVCPDNLPEKTYTAKLKEWNAETVENVLLQGKEIQNKEATPSQFEGFQPASLYELKDGASLFVGDGNIYFHEEKAIRKGYTSYVKGYSSFIDPNLKEIFAKDTLSNVDKQSSIDSFKNLCNQLGIIISGKPTVYALDAETLDQKTDYDQEQPDGTTIEKWVEEDQVYCLTDYVLYEGFPITQQGYIGRTGYGIGTRLYSFFNADGLVGFGLSNSYEITDEGKKIEEICSLETANQVIKEKYKNIILTNPVTISKISLEYVPVQIDEAKQLYSLVPMWVYTASQDEEETKEGSTTTHTHNFEIYIDALKGVEFDVAGII